MIRAFIVAALAIGSVACVALPNADDAFEHVERCTNHELLDAYASGKHAYRMIVEADYREVRQVYAVTFHRLPGGWEYVGTDRLAGPETQRHTVDDKEFDIAEQAHEKFWPWMIPIAIILALVAVWTVRGQGDSYGAATRWYRITRRTKTPHQTRSHYSTGSIDVDDRDERDRR